MMKNGETWGEVVESSGEKRFRGFFGNYQHSLDIKGRVFIPAKFRDGLAPEFMLAKWLDGRIAAFPMSKFDEISEKLENIPFSDSNGRQFMDFVYNGASPCEVDKQGRISIPPDLREYAGLDKDVCIAGASDYVAIWDYDTWKKRSNEYDKNADALAESIQKHLF